MRRRERNERARVLLGELGLTGRAKDRLDWFSGGLQQRVMLGRALMHRLCDRIAIMDHGRVLALDAPAGLKRLVPGGTMLEMRVRGAGDGDGHGDPVRSALQRLPGVQGVERPAAQPAEDRASPTAVYRLYASEEPGPLLASAAQTVIAERAELVDLRLARPSLEDVFIHLTGSNLRS